MNLLEQNQFTDLEGNPIPQGPSAELNAWIQNASSEELNNFYSQIQANANANPNHIHTGGPYGHHYLSTDGEQLPLCVGAPNNSNPNFIFGTAMGPNGYSYESLVGLCNNLFMGASEGGFSEDQINSTAFCCDLMPEVSFNNQGTDTETPVDPAPGEGFSTYGCSNLADFITANMGPNVNMTDEEKISSWCGYCIGPYGEGMMSGIDGGAEACECCEDETYNQSPPTVVEPPVPEPLSPSPKVEPKKKDKKKEKEKEKKVNVKKQKDLVKRIKEVLQLNETTFCKSDNDCSNGQHCQPIEGTLSLHECVDIGAAHTTSTPPKRDIPNYRNANVNKKNIRFKENYVHKRTNRRSRKG